MSRYDDRQRLFSVMSDLDSVARSGASNESALRATLGHIAEPDIVGEVAEKRMDQSFRNFAQQKRRLELQDVRNMIMGAWMEGFVAGNHYSEKKHGG